MYTGANWFRKCAHRSLDTGVIIAGGSRNHKSEVLEIAADKPKRCDES
jgi:hypothetical protein